MSRQKFNTKKIDHDKIAARIDDSKIDHGKIEGRVRIRILKGFRGLEAGAVISPPAALREVFMAAKIGGEPVAELLDDVTGPKKDVVKEDMPNPQFTLGE